MNHEQARILTELIEKIRAFEGLAFSEVQRLLKVCRHKVYKAGETIYAAGDPSLEMLLLLKGHLKAVGKTGTILGDIHPGTCCGEMGVFSGHPRSANVVAVIRSTGFAITKKDLDQILEENIEIRARILQNLVTMFSERLAKANMQVENYARQLQSTREELEMLEGLEEGWKAT